jgi:VIT1/CCC1 family predicted Fe2+/Mn2+ transporter
LPATASREDLRRYRENYLSECDGAALYRGLAAAEKDAKRAALFEKLARAEERHAGRWAKLLREAGELLPEARPSLRVRALAALARALGTRRVLPIVTSLEARDQDLYVGQPEAAGLPAEERGHGRALRALESRGGGLEAVLARERWHLRGAGGSLRAAVFGVNDGLVSNLALVMGVAGADVGPELVRLTGVAGLLAGSFSMAAGEYLSMRVQRELLERQISLEREELESYPEEEQEELALIYQAKGIPEGEARALAERIIADPRAALDTLAREELGLDPSELGSPWGAAASSFLSFAIGAVVPVLPFLAFSGRTAFAASAAASGLALLGVGALLSIFTARGPLPSGLRMLGIGLVAALVTFSIGRWLGVSVAG